MQICHTVLLKKEKNIIYVVPNIYNVQKLTIAQKQNGTVLKLAVNRVFKKQDISYSISTTNWLSITILEAELDSSSIAHTRFKRPH